MRWTVIGAGGLADRVAIPALKKILGNEIVAVCDTNKERAEKVAENHGIPAYFTDAEEMFVKTLPDAVYIVTPVAFHYPLAKLALKYKVHTFVEKPFTMTGDEGKELVREFEKAGLQLTVGYMMGFNGLHKKAHDIIKDGGIGQVTLVRMNYHAWYPDIEGAWRQIKKLGGGGAIMDLAVHCLELFSSITDEEIVECRALYGTQTFSYEVDDSAVIVFKSEKGTLGNVDVGFNMPVAANTSGFEIFGTKGSIKGYMTYGGADRGKIVHTFVEDPLANEPDKVKTYYGKGKSSFVKQFELFGKCVLANCPDYKNATRATNIQKLIDKIYNNK